MALAIEQIIIGMTWVKNMYFVLEPCRPQGSSEHTLRMAVFDNITLGTTDWECVNELKG